MPTPSHFSKNVGILLIVLTLLYGNLAIKHYWACTLYANKSTWSNKGSVAYKFIVCWFPLRNISRLICWHVHAKHSLLTLNNGLLGWLQLWFVTSTYQDCLKIEALELKDTPIMAPLHHVKFSLVSQLTTV